MDRTTPSGIAAMTINEERLNEFLGKAVGDLGAAMSATPDAGRRPAGPVQGAGEAAAHLGRARRAHRHPRTLRARVAGQPGRRRLRRSTTPAASRYSLERRNRPCAWPTRTARSTCPAPIRWSRPPSMRWTAPGQLPHAARAWNGANTTPACSTAPSASSAPATTRNLFSEWMPALDGVVEKLEGRRARSPTSAAATARAPR